MDFSRFLYLSASFAIIFSRVSFSPSIQDRSLEEDEEDEATLQIPTKPKASKTPSSSSRSVLEEAEDTILKTRTYGAFYRIFIPPGDEVLPNTEVSTYRIAFPSICYLRSILKVSYKSRMSLRGGIPCSCSRSVLEVFEPKLKTVSYRAARTCTVYIILCSHITMLLLSRFSV